MSDDLFNIPARARNTDPDTSHRAAREVTPHTDTIRAEVERWARGRGPEGFIDEELSAAFDAKDSSSYRTRRGELTAAGRIVDSGRRRMNDNARQCIVWRHKDCNWTPEPVREMSTREKLLAHANRMQEDADYVRKQYGLVGLAANLEQTAKLLKDTLAATAGEKKATEQPG